MKTISDADHKRIQRLLRALASYDTTADVTRKGEWRRQALQLLRKMEKQS